MNVLLVEPDRVLASCIAGELAGRNIDCRIVPTAELAIEAADSAKPDVVITELSLGGHSGSEFIYEFRSYPDWQTIPLIIYSSIKIDDSIVTSKDWQHCNITELLYKPHDSLDKLCTIVEQSVAV